MSDSVEVTARETFAGVSVEIDAAGDYRIDTSEAVGGDVLLSLAEGRALTIEVGGKVVFQVTANAGTVRIDLGGSGTERLVLGDALKQFLDEFFQTKFDLHVHPTSTGPSGPPLPAFAGTSVPDAVLSNVARTRK